jgi:hypothetical protein
MVAVLRLPVAGTNSGARRDDLAAPPFARPEGGVSPSFGLVTVRVPLEKRAPDAIGPSRLLL